MPAYGCRLKAYSMADWCSGMDPDSSCVSAMYSRIYTALIVVSLAHVCAVCSGYD